MLRKQLAPWMHAQQQAVDLSEQAATMYVDAPRMARPAAVLSRPRKRRARERATSYSPERADLRSQNRGEKRNLDGRRATNVCTAPNWRRGSYGAFCMSSGSMSTGRHLLRRPRVSLDCFACPPSDRHKSSFGYKKVSLLQRRLRPCNLKLCALCCGQSPLRDV